jgi:drug/metabolite transporter (DMT)-like permease
MEGGIPNLSYVSQQKWFIYALLLGGLFIVMFNILAITSQNNGLGVAAVASKMSLIIPVIAGIVLYQEQLVWLQYTGIILALVSVYLTSLKEDSALNKVKNQLLWPLLLFIGSGAIDTLIKLAQNNYLNPSEGPLFSSMCFITAFCIGIVLLIRDYLNGNPLTMKSILAGLVLGVPNYFSIYFLIKTLQTGIASSVIYPINNVGTVILTTLLGILIFKERISKKNAIGVIIAIIAIACIAFAKAY